ncbi:OsmC family protein [Thermomonospora echinospora]|uniref:OsmC family protein n=1 Tax=Thermomonospora echinospora TaxID=1992 RepID=UPI0013580521|nr:OsmC family protein [Thermomonospora echinospora]
MIHIDQPPDVLDHDTGPTPVELFVAGVAADLAQHARRYLNRLGLPACVSVTAHYRTELQPARLGGIEMEVAVTDLPLGLRASLLNVLERCTLYETLRLQPDLSIKLTSTTPHMATEKT